MQHRTVITEHVIKPTERVISLLMSNAKNLGESNQEFLQTQLTLKKSLLVAALASYGTINLVVGLLGVMAARVFIGAYSPDSAKTMLINSLFNILIGVLILSSSWTLAKGRVQAVWLYLGSILLASMYSIAIGYGLNYFFIGLALILTWLIFRSRNEWKLV